MSEELPFANALKSSSAFKLIKNDFSLGLGNAYLIISPDEDAVQSFFRLIGCAVFCEQQHSACLECSTCMQVLHYNHPDIKFFNQEKEAIKMDAMRDYLNDIRLIPFSNHLLVFIERLDLSQDRVMNTLLKTLEEPPKGVSFFIGTANENGILDTIKSRCRKVYLDVFDNDIIIEELTRLDVSQEDAEIAAVLADGQLGKARRMALSDKFKQEYEDISTILKKIQKSTDIIYYDGLFGNKKDNIEMLNIMSTLLRDVMLYKRNECHLKDGIVKENIMEIAETFTEKSAAKSIEAINVAKGKLASNAPNIVAIIDSLLFSILEEKHKWQ